MRHWGNSKLYRSIRLLGSVLFVLSIISFVNATPLNNDGYKSTAISPTSCLEVNAFNLFGSNASSAHIDTVVFLVNNCPLDINLARYHFLFPFYDTQNRAVMINPAISTLDGVNPHPQIQTNFTEVIYNGLPNLIGRFSNYSPPTPNSLILKSGAGLTFKSSTSYSHSFSMSLSMQRANTFLTIDNAMLAEAATVFPYGRDALTDIPVGKNGLKTLVVTNYSVNQINQINFRANLPADIVYDAPLTTCKLDGYQVLNPNQSCNIVFRFTPKIEGENSELSVTIVGIDSQLQTITAPTVNLLYNSRQTGNPQAGMVATADAKIGIMVSVPESFPYGRDSLEDVSVGSFGLKSYIITNTSPFDLYAITFWPELSGDFSYDNIRSTCLLNNKQLLKVGSSCNLVIKYLPNNYGVHGVIPLQVVGVNPYTPIKYTTYVSQIMDVPYSSK